MKLKANSYKLTAFLIICMFVLYAGTVFSANSPKPVKGEIPVLPPLQTPAENAEPNFSGSIQFQGGVFDQEPVEQPQADNSTPAQDFVDNILSPVAPAAKDSGNYTIWIILILLALALGGGVGYYLHVHNKKTE
jgi:hypothetical protein